MDRSYLSILIVGGAATTAVLHRVAVSSIIRRLTNRFETISIKGNQLTKISTACDKQPIYTTTLSGVQVTVKGTGWKGLASARSFYREVQALSKAQPHNNIPRFKGLYLSSISDIDINIGFGMIYEYAKGVTLHSMIRDPNFIITDTLKYSLLSQLIAAMSHLHSCGVIHRDLKPQNIIVDTETLQLKIIDFGSATCINPTGFFTNIYTENDVGTTAYMAPEVWLGKPCTAKTDVYSFAFVLAELLSRGSPWSAAERRLLPFILESKRPDVNPKCEVDKVIYSIIKLCWLQNPSDRPSFASLQGYLDSVDKSFDLCDVNNDDIISRSEFENEFGRSIPKYIINDGMTGITRLGFLYAIQKEQEGNPKVPTLASLR